MKKCTLDTERTSQYDNQLLCLLCSPFNPNSKCFDCKFIALPQRKWSWKQEHLSFGTSSSLTLSFSFASHTPVSSAPPLASLLTSSDSPLLSGPFRNVWGSMFCSGRAGLDPLSARLETTLTDLLHCLAERSTVNVLGVNLVYRLVVQGCVSPRGDRSKDTTSLSWRLIWCYFLPWFPLIDNAWQS